jgi:hypothetical protein
MTLCATCGYPIEGKRLRRLHGIRQRRARCALCVSKVRAQRSLDELRTEERKRMEYEERVREARKCAGGD